MIGRWLTRADESRRLPPTRGLMGLLWALAAIVLMPAAPSWAQPTAASVPTTTPVVATHFAVSPSAPQSAAPTAGFTVHEFDWIDASRQGRSVPVRLDLPHAASASATASATAAAPVIVFSHGIGGSRRGYSYLGQHWASQGYASLHLQHVGSDRGVWTGNPFAMFFRLQSAADESEAVARVHDLRFALDRLLASEFAPRLDAKRIAAAGHSYGANTALLAAGAQVRRNGLVMDLHDARVRCAIIISAPPFYGETDTPAILGPISVPTLHVTATDDVIRVPGYFSPASDRLAVFEATGGATKVLAVFAGGSHSMFTDRAGTGGIEFNPQVKAATQALSVAFLRQVFEGEPLALRQWPQRFAALLARFTPPH